MTARILLILLLLATACATPGPTAQPAVRPAAPAGSAAELVNQAETAWKRSAFGQSLALYSAALARPDLKPEARPQAYERAAGSALELKDHPQALDLLRKWAAADKGAKADWSWHAMYVRGLLGLGLVPLTRDHLAGLVADTREAYGLRAKAAVKLAELELIQGRLAEAAWALRTAHAAAPDEPARVYLERDLLASLQSLDDARILPLAGPVIPDLAFPQTIFRLAAAQRLAQDSGDRSQEALRMASQLVEQRHLADPEPARRIMASGSVAPPSEAPLPSPPETPPAQPARTAGTTALALAVPLSGRLGEVGQKIMAGAAMAQAQLPVTVSAVNTAEADWLERLAALPPDVRLVGGPLRVDELRAAAEAGQTQARRFFAFIQTLGNLREGQDAWRFFGSPQDQTRAVVDLSVSLGIVDFAVLAPADPFGERMTDIFQTEVQSRGASLAAVETYNPAQPQSFGAKVRTLLQNGGFRAVLLPDNLAKAQQLAPFFHFHDAEHLLLLGPELWAQSMASAAASGNLEDNYLSLAVFPGAYDPAGTAPANEALRQAAAQAGVEADFWTALGYDFVRLAAQLGPEADEDLNSRLHRLTGFDFSLAPMAWDAQGLASQRLFLFRPTRQGARPVNQDDLLEQLRRAETRREDRARLKAEQDAKKN